MWSKLILCLLVGSVIASTNPGWKENTEYVYKIRGRTLASLHEVAQEYTGIILRATLTIRPDSDNLYAKITEPQYAPVHISLAEGWESYIPDDKLTYKQLQLTQEYFKIVMKNGVVRDVVVPKEVTNWEANMIKGIVSQIQLDTKAERLIDSHVNTLPEEAQYSAVFKTMEDTVTGISETLYDIHLLPEYILQTQPHLAPLPELKSDGRHMEVVKTKNFTHSLESPMYHYGWGDLEGVLPSSNKLGQILEKSSVSRAVISGKWDRYTVQSTYTVNEIMVRPTLNNQQKGSVVSMVNLTLHSYQPQFDPIPQIRNPVNLGSLVYRFNEPTGTNEVRPGKPYQPHRGEHENPEYRRFRRSLRENGLEGSDEQEKHGGEDSREYHEQDKHTSNGQKYWQQQKQLELEYAPESPLVPFNTGYMGKSIKNSQNFNIAEKAEKLAEEIAKDFETPEQIPKKNSLSKFAILASLTRSMSYEDIKTVDSQLYKNDNQGRKSLPWLVFSDAIAESGTGPALLAIREWLLTKKLEHYEAADVISTMARSARVPDEKYMKAFYVLVTRPQIVDQYGLNDTALLAFTDLAHRVYVNHKYTHNMYPVHSFGGFYTESGKEFLRKEVIPYFEKKLNEAVAKADSQKIQVYIRVLGNIGDRKILEVFEPYLEGKKQVSQFQRLMMVLSLDKIVKHHPKLAMSVLYKVYQNYGEAQEIRVAAVYQFMRTNPPTEVLQRMAMYTNIDTHEQVNSAVKSAIETASEREGDDFAQMRDAARAAKAHLTPREYGHQYSKDYLRSYVVDEMNYYYEQAYNTIGDEELYMPRGIKYVLGANIGGYRENCIMADYYVSSVDELMHVWLRQSKEHREEERQARRADGNEWYIPKVAKLLDLHLEEREQMEGNLNLKIGDFQRYLAFSNQTIQIAPELFRKIETELRNGKQYDYTKVSNRGEKALSYATEMGIPFIYTFDVPTIVSVKGEVKAEFNPRLSFDNLLNMPETISASSKYSILISEKMQGQIGFITPFDHHQYAAGFDKNMQAYLPVNGKLDINLKQRQVQIEVEPIDPKKSTKIFHYSSVPYTGSHDILETAPILDNQRTQVIRKRGYETRINKLIGQESVGFAFRVDIASEQRFWNPGFWYDKISRHDPISLLMSGRLDETIQNTHVNVDYAGDLSYSRKLVVKMGYDHEYKPTAHAETENNRGSYNDISNFADTPADEITRRQDFMKRVAAGIRSPYAWVYDASFEFYGQRNVKFIATGAFAKSDVDPKSRALIYWQGETGTKPQHLALSVKGHFPNTNGLDMSYAMDFDPTSNIQVQLAYGEDFKQATKFNAHAELKKTEYRKNWLMDTPKYKLCRDQMQQGNYHLQACANMTQEANLLDHIKLKIEYEQADPIVMHYASKALRGIEYLGYYNLEESRPDSRTDKRDNEIEVDARFYADLKNVNVTVKTKNSANHFANIRVNDWAKQILVAHPVFDVKSRVMGRALGLETYRPYCVMDQSAAKTFDNVTYPLTLGNPWFVMLQYARHQGRHHLRAQKSEESDEQLKHQREKYQVLVRTNQEKREQKDVFITVNTPRTQFRTVEIELSPVSTQTRGFSGSSPSAKISVNGKQISYDDKKDHDIEGGIIRVYALPNGEAKVEVQGAFYIIYDSARVKVTAVDDKLRNSIYGLCGNFDGEKDNEFKSPKGCILRDVREFEASHALYNAGEHRELEQYKSQARKSGHCIYQETLYANVISNRDAGRQEARRVPRGDDSSMCTKHQTRYVVEDRTVCFTVHPIPVCKDECRERGKIEKNISVHCVQKSNVAELWKKQIEDGGSPDFSAKAPTKTMAMDLPLGCTK